MPLFGLRIFVNFCISYAPFWAWNNVFSHLFPICFEVLSCIFVYCFVVISYKSSSWFYAPFLTQNIFFPLFLLIAMSYWAVALSYWAEFCIALLSWSTDNNWLSVYQVVHTSSRGHSWGVLFGSQSNMDVMLVNSNLETILILIFSIMP